MNDPVEHPPITRTCRRCGTSFPVTGGGQQCPSCGRRYGMRTGVIVGWIVAGVAATSIVSFAAASTLTNNIDRILRDIDPEVAAELRRELDLPAKEEDGRGASEDGDDGERGAGAGDEASPPEPDEIAPYIGVGSTFDAGDVAYQVVEVRHVERADGIRIEVDLRVANDGDDDVRLARSFASAQREGGGPVPGGDDEQGGAVEPLGFDPVTVKAGRDEEVRLLFRISSGTLTDLVLTLRDEAFGTANRVRLDGGAG